VADLFVSYSRADADAVRRLCEALVALQRDVWVDWRDIPPTAQWRDEIRAAIDAASAVVFVISPASVASAECRHELDHAVARGKRLVPVVLQKPDMAEVPAKLAELNWIFLLADDLDASVGQLIQAVDTDLAWSRAHAELLRRATAWQAAERDPSKLLRGKDLVEAERWLATDTSAPAPVAVQSSFVLASRTAAVRGQRVRVALAVSVAIVATGLSIWAFLERQVAQRRYQEALSRQLTIESNTARDAAPGGLVLSVQLAAEAMRRAPSPEAADALRAGLRLLPRLRWQVPLPTRTGMAVRFTPDGSQLATADAVWDAATGAVRVELDHDGRTHAFAMSADARLVARIGTERDVELWNRADGTRRPLHAPPARVPFEALAFSPDGRWLVAADARHTVQVWETATGALVQSLPAPEPYLSGPVRGLAFAPDAGTIAVARRQRVERWETATWSRLEPALSMESGAVAAIDYAADGRLAVVTSAGVTAIHAPDGTSGTTVRLPSDLGRPESLRFSPDGRHLGVATTSGAQVLRAEDGKTILPRVPGGALAFAPDDTRVAVGGRDRTVRVIDLATGRELARMVHEAGATAFDWSPDSATLATLGEDGMLRLFETRVAFPIADLPGTTGAFDDTGRHLLAHGERQAAALWSAESRRILRLPVEGSPRLTVPSADGTRLAAVLGDSLLVWPLPGAGDPVRLEHEPAIDWDAVGRREVDERGGALRAVASRLGMLRDAGSVEIAAMSPDGRRVLTTRIDELARLWDTTSGTLVASIPYHVETTAAFSGDGARLAVAAASGVQVLDAASGRPLATVDAKGRAPRVLLDHDGRRLIVHEYRQATLWDVDSGRMLTTIPEVRWVRLAPGGRVFVTEEGNAARLRDVAAGGTVLAEATCTCSVRETVLSADGRRAAIVGDMNRIYLRSVDRDGPAREIEHTGRIDQVTFSPDGRLLAMTGGNPVMGETLDKAGQPVDTGEREPWQRLEEAVSGRAIELQQEQADGTDLVFSADGRYLAAGRVVWDATTGRRLARTEEPVIAFSPDASLLLTREEGAVRAWPWRNDDLLALACRQLSRNLSGEEWLRHVSGAEPPAKTCAGLR
jgi:WD40 repeat protein